MEITIKGEAKEIAALLLEIKARPGEDLATGLGKALKENEVQYRLLNAQEHSEILSQKSPEITAEMVIAGVVPDK